MPVNTIREDEDHYKLQNSGGNEKETPDDDFNRVKVKFDQESFNKDLD